MSKRERYLKALRNEQVDQLVWAPNFDYWMGVNEADGTLPDRYRGMSRNDIVRAIGGCIWNRAAGLRVVRDADIKESWRAEGDITLHEFATPAGTIREVLQRTEGAHTSPATTEHFIKDLDSLEVMKYVVEATSYEPEYEKTRVALEETGDDGVVLNPYFCVPFIQFAKSDAGYVNAFYMWMDNPEEVSGLVDLYFRKFLEGYAVLSAGPADVIATGDNMDGVMISPDLFRQHAIPFYQEAQKICHSHGKIFEGHWCGRTQNLLPLTPGCGLDVVEAIVTEPMAGITLSDALDALREEVVLQGGIPSVMVCDEGCSPKEFERYIRDVVLPQKGRRGFILGMSDNVPPNADFSRVEAIAGLIA